MGFYNMKQFQDNLFKFVEEDIPREFTNRQIEVIVFMFESLKSLTPRMSGHAIANWRVTVNAPEKGEVGKRISNNKTTARETSTARVRSYLTTANLLQGSKSIIRRGSHLIQIYNNVPYLQYLEAGNVREASKGYMVERTIARAKVFMAIKGWR
jgi:hypothetical protein